MRLAVERQHEVAALVRQGSAFTLPPGVDLRFGEVTDQTVLDGAVIRQDAVLADSGRDWLVVRPVTLTDGPPTGKGRSVRRYRLTSTLKRSDVAAWMLDAVERRDPLV